MGRDDSDKRREYAKRFGQIAVEKGYITEEDLFGAIKIQIREDLRGQPHRFVGMILFRMGLMSIKEVDEVMNEVLKGGSG